MGRYTEKKKQSNKKWDEANLRNGSYKMPIELYEKGTELTKIGLGFPQYANDDVVIPCLEHWGYSTEDARNYTIAACWDFIIPNEAMDIPNIGGMPIAELVRNAVVNHLNECEKESQQHSMKIIFNSRFSGKFLQSAHFYPKITG